LILGDLTYFRWHKEWFLAINNVFAPKPLDDGHVGWGLGGARREQLINSGKFINSGIRGGEEKSNGTLD
jgi:hypothetical protein